MSDILRNFLSSGKELLVDTKVRKKVVPEKGKKTLPEPAKGSSIDSSDPHEVFVKKSIADKPKKADIVKQIQKFCREEDAKL